MNIGAAWEIAKEHKYGLAALFLFGLGVALAPFDRHGSGGFLLVFAIVALAAYSVFVEFPRSRFQWVRAFGWLAWMVMFLGSLLTGWQRWIDLG